MCAQMDKGSLWKIGGLQPAAGAASPMASRQSPFRDCLFMPEVQTSPGVPSKDLADESNGYCCFGTGERKGGRRSIATLSWFNSARTSGAVLAGPGQNQCRHRRDSGGRAGHGRQTSRTHLSKARRRKPDRRVHVCGRIPHFVLTGSLSRFWNRPCSELVGAATFRSFSRKPDDSLPPYENLVPSFASQLFYDGRIVRRRHRSAL